MKIDQPSMELHRKFQKLGNERNRLTYQLLNLLPEINNLRVYEKYGYSSIIAYAGVVGGLSEGVVKKRLNLEKNLKDKPNLKKAVATQGVHKVAIVAKLATPETEKEWDDLFELKAGEVKGTHKYTIHNKDGELLEEDDQNMWDAQACLDNAIHEIDLKIRIEKQSFNQLSNFLTEGTK